MAIQSFMTARLCLAQIGESTSRMTRRPMGLPLARAPTSLVRTMDLVVEHLCVAVCVLRKQHEVFGCCDPRAQTVIAE